MSVIQEEEEATIYPDLYNFENNCIDFLLSMKRMRQKNPNYTPEDAIRPAKEMQSFLVQTLEQLEKQP